MQDPKTGFPIRKKESDMTKQRLFVASAFGMLIAGVLVFATEPVYDSSPTQKIGYSTDLKKLRISFNAGKSKVRLLTISQVAIG